MWCGQVAEAQPNRQGPFYDETGYNLGDRVTFLRRGDWCVPPTNAQSRECQELGLEGLRLLGVNLASKQLAEQVKGALDDAKVLNNAVQGMG